MQAITTIGLDIAKRANNSGRAFAPWRKSFLLPMMQKTHDNRSLPAAYAGWALARRCEWWRTLHPLSA
jgi:hypothetical protein